MANYIQKGNTIDYVATDAIAAGDVVGLTTRIGVAAGDIPAGAVGALAVEGVFEIERPQASPSALAMPSTSALPPRRSPRPTPMCLQVGRLLTLLLPTPLSV